MKCCYGQLQEIQHCNIIEENKIIDGGLKPIMTMPVSEKQNFIYKYNLAFNIDNTSFSQCLLLRLCSVSMYFCLLSVFKVFILTFIKLNPLKLPIILITNITKIILLLPITIFLDEMFLHVNLTANLFIE
ncbi:hypothetical protein ILUMI_07717 [Ignelater luminosus]|uniref:Uncharacterized protein n=1 Tax=Ignelater luminosus TaxID=2038154 RepID=A0A8K0D5W6_IGNLU|nr:hypothetical protein ILUMI_07717 [Ignelater luminosus]